MKIDISGMLEQGKTEKKHKNMLATSTNINGTKTEVVASKSYSVKQTQIGKSGLSCGKTSQDLQEEALNIDFETTRDQMILLSNTLTAEDYQKAQEEGFPVNGTEIEKIVTVTDKIKIALATAGIDVSDWGDAPDLKEVERLTNNKGMARTIVKAFKEHDLPLSKDNVKEFENAVEQEENLAPLSKESVKYCLQQNIEPTIENLYKMQNSGVMKENLRTNPVPAWNGMDEQIEMVLKQENIPIDEKTMESAKWLVEQELPLTKEYLVQKEALESLILPLKEQELATIIAQTIADGKRPLQASLLPQTSIIDRGNQIVETLQNTTDNQLDLLMRQGQELTIQNLKLLQSGSNQNQEIDIALLPQIDEGELLKAKRQLEETRLQMTLSVSVQMLKQGIEVETESLQQLVEKLKEVEQGYYKTLLEQSDIKATPEKVDLLQNTMETVEQLQTVPSYIVGHERFAQVGVENTPAFLHNENSTLSQIQQEGHKLKQELEKANQSYETLMTKPRADMGDNIQKAFQNVEAILVDLQVDNTQANERSVRILGYNQMEITKDSILAVKEADLKVQQLMKELTPPVVLELIRKGSNPLQVPVEELLAQVEDIQKEIGNNSEEKFSEFLWKLEHSEGITESEREAYIGIFRLFRQVEKTDGAVIGALVQQGSDLTMKNLLTGVRSKKEMNKTWTVDEKFGGVDPMQSQTKSISNQIEQGFLNTSYYEVLAKEVVHNVTPTTMKKVSQNIDWSNLNLEQFGEYLVSQEPSPIEEMDYIRSNLHEFTQAQQTEAEVMKILADFDIPMTSNYMRAAQELLQSSGGMFKRLYEKAEQTSDTDTMQAFEQAKESLYQDFADNLSAPEEMAKAQVKLAELAERVMDSMIIKEDVTSLDLKEIKLMQQEIKLSIQFGKEEFYEIPVMIGDNMGAISLKIVRGKQEKGKVQVFMDDLKYGKIAAEFTVNSNQVEALIAGSNKETIEHLRQQEDQLKEMLSIEEVEAVDFHYAVSDSLDLLHFQSKSGKNDSTQMENQVQTKVLYAIAKNFIHNLGHVSDK